MLLTRGESSHEWLRAGQALHRLLLHAASERVFASLYTQPLENPLTRALIRDRLALPGHPQLLLQLGRARSWSHSSSRSSGSARVKPNRSSARASRYRQVLGCTLSRRAAAATSVSASR